MSKDRDDAKEKFDNAGGQNEGMNSIFPETENYTTHSVRDYILLLIVVLIIIGCAFGGFRLILFLIGGY